jgi:hypothetical protein
MITFVRSVTAQPGKIGEAVAWGKEIVRIVKRATGKDITLCTSFGGAIGGVAWIVQYDNMGQAEEFLMKLLGDHDYVTALATAQQLFVPGSGHDQFWKQA